MTTRLKVLVTGASGFIGSHVARQFAANGHAVTVLARSTSDLGRIADIAPRGLTVLRVDPDPTDDRLVRAVAATQPDVAVHCAWAGVGGSARNDSGQVGNFAATLALIDACAQAGVARWIGLGSQAEYGPQGGVIGESTPTRPTTLYGTVKLATGVAAEAICRQANMEFAWVRVFSTYGPGDNPDWMIPSLALALARRERPALTAGTQRWDFLHVRDAAAAIALLAEATGQEGVFNLGSGVVRTIRSVAEAVRDFFDPALGLEFGEVPFRSDQVMHLEADIGRLRALGWAPRVPWAEGLKETVTWYRDRVAHFVQPVRTP